MSSLQLAIRPSRLHKLILFHQPKHIRCLSRMPEVVSTTPINPVEDVARPIRTRILRHPYSLHEFEPDIPNYEVQWRLEQQRMEAFNNEFWTSNNARFEEGKRAALESLSSSATPDGYEQALSDFYSRWVVQETPRHHEYTKEWRNHNFALLTMEARITYNRLKSRISAILLYK